jgi:hypothetical protein
MVGGNVNRVAPGAQLARHPPSVSSEFLQTLAAVAGEAPAQEFEAAMKR